MVKLLNKESVIYTGLLAVTATVIYFTSDFIQLVYFIFLFILFSFSRKDYFWLAFFAAIIFETGGFFVYDMFIELGPTPFSLVFFFSILTSIKGYLRYRKNIFIFKKQFNIWLGLLIYLLVLGLVFYGLEPAGKTGYRWYFLLGSFLICIPSIFILPKYFINYNFLVKFSKLIFLTVFINILGQIIHLALRNPVFLIFNPDFALGSLQDVDFSETLIRPVWGHWGCFLALFLALYFYIKKDNSFSSKFLILVIFTNYITVLISATRGWFLAFSFIIILFIIIYSASKKSKLILQSVFAFLLLFILLFNLSSAFRIQTILATERLLTLKLIVEGDPTAGGTNSRLTRRNDKVMDEFRKHPIFGNGFSTKAFEVNDQHVGNQNILMEGGIVGYLVNAYIWFSILYVIYKFHIISKKQRYYNRELLLLLIAFGGLFIIHSSSSAIFGHMLLIPHAFKFLFISYIFGIFNCILFINRTEITQN
ncbi:O-antigen ligase family protein [Bacteroidota bacterium]